MGKAILAEESLLNYLTNLSKSTTGFIPGLIVGQSLVDCDYVLHLMRTPLHGAETKDLAPVKIGSLAKISNLQESWAAEHAKCVTRMLPGGVWVFGLFVIGPDDIFMDTVGQNKLRSTLIQIQKRLSADKFLHGNGPNSEKIVLQFARNSLRYSCKSFDLGDLGNSSLNLKSVEWRFVSNPTRWHQLKCHFNLDSLNSLYFTPQHSKQTLRNQFDKVVEAVSDNLDNSIFTINGQTKSKSLLLNNLEENKTDAYSTKISDSKTGPLKRNTETLLSTHLVDFYQDSENVSSSKVINKKNSLELKCCGVIESHVYLHEKASVEEGIKTLKEDIIRCLFSRLEMHYETLIEEEASTSSRESCVLHELPRRVTVALNHSDINFYDYLFPGEGVSEILLSLQEFLDLKVDASHINKNFEGKTGDSFDGDERLFELSKQGSKLSQHFNLPITHIAGLIIVFSILLFSIILQLYWK